MKSIKIISILFLISTLSSCKKNYTCFCMSERCDSSGFTIKDTKQKATKKCKSYTPTIQNPNDPITCTLQ